MVVAIVMVMLLLMLTVTTLKMVVVVVVDGEGGGYGNVHGNCRIVDKYLFQQDSFRLSTKVEIKAWFSGYLVFNNCSFF